MSATAAAHISQAYGDAATLVPARPKGTEPEVMTFVERFAAEVVKAGTQRMPARVFAALPASEEGALSSAEPGERLQVSPAAVSGAVRHLAQVGMLVREREPGSRRDRYRAGPRTEPPAGPRRPISCPPPGPAYRGTVSRHADGSTVHVRDRTGPVIAESAR